MAAATTPPLSTAQFEEIIDLIQEGLTSARGVLRDIRTADNPLLPDFLDDIWQDEVEPFCLSAEALLLAVERAVESAPAPLRMMTMANDWGGRIQEYATEVEAKTRWTQLHALDEWEGSAADRYRKRILPQSSAAERLGDMSSAVAASLGVSASSGFIFYGGVALVVTKLLWGLHTAANQLRSGPAALTGIALGLAAIKSAKFEYGKLLAVFGIFIVEQAGDLIALVVQANDHGQFPDNRWPTGVVEA